MTYTTTSALQAKKAWLDKECRGREVYKSALNDQCQQRFPSSTKASSRLSGEKRALEVRIKMAELMAEANLRI